MSGPCLHCAIRRAIGVFGKEHAPKNPETGRPALDASDTLHALMAVAAEIVAGAPAADQAEFVGTMQEMLRVELEGRAARGGVTH